MGKFNEYSQKATPADNDTLMIYDATSKSNKLSPFSGIWNWIVGKLTNAVISNLQTSNKTVVGALNELNSNKISNTRFAVQHIYYSDSQVAELGGLDACVQDALNNTLPKDGAFYGTFVSKHQYLMIGYRYVNGSFGCIILFDFSNNTERWNIDNSKVTKANLSGIEFLTRTITVESGKQAYDLQINATEYMVISICSEDRMGWRYTVTRGVSGTEAAQNWAVCFIGNPTGTFTFKVAVLKIK